MSKALASGYGHGLSGSLDGGERVGACLRHQREKGLVRSRPGPGAYLVWEMAR